jgi:hypothetical protein
MSCLSSLSEMYASSLTATLDVATGTWSMRLYVQSSFGGLAEITPDAAGGRGWCERGNDWPA